MYQNNGAVFDRINGIKSRPLVGAVVIEWDGWKYTGKFTSFSFTFDESQPHFVHAEIQFEAVTKEAYDEDFSIPVPLTDLNGGLSAPSVASPVSPLAEEISQRVVNVFRRQETRQPENFANPDTATAAPSQQPNRLPFGQRK
jgi:hypothetical protein